MLQHKFIGRFGSLLTVLALTSACAGGEIGDGPGRFRLGPESDGLDGIAQPEEPGVSLAAASCPGASPDVSASDGWLSSKASLPAFGTLYFETMARPTAANLDGLMAVGAVDIDDFAEAAITVRFADDGLVDVRDGDVYTSDLSYAYEPGVWYTVAISADIATETYDVEIGRCGEPKETLISGAQFRYAADVSDQLSTWAVWSSQTAALELSTPMWMASGGCAPATCQSLGQQCGQPSNGCGGSLNCGICGSGDSCASGLCVQDSTPPPAPAPAPVPPPPGAGDPTDRPWEHNTGPSNPGALTPSGSLMITTDGAVYENLDVNGDIWIDADNVTIRNFRINAGGASYGMKVFDGHSGVVIEDGEITGFGSAGILGVGYTASRLHVHTSGGDAFKIQGVGGPTVLQTSFVEKFGLVNGVDHSDAVQSNDSTLTTSNVTIRRNNFYMPNGIGYYPNANFMLQQALSNWVIEENWLDGGTYTVYCYDYTTQVTVRNNFFGRSSLYGLNAPQRPCKSWTGNVWEDTGDPI